MSLHLLVILLTISLISASSLTSNISTDDGFILNFAITLKYLQRALYECGLATFAQKDFVTAGFDDPFYTNLQQIYFDQQSHAYLLNNVLLAAGIKPAVPLEYSFPYTDISSFVKLASIIEGISVSA